MGVRRLRKDSAGRSIYGQLLEAKKSGHHIQRDEPELVIQSIKDVIRESTTPFQQKRKQDEPADSSQTR